MEEGETPQLQSKEHVPSPSERIMACASELGLKETGEMQALREKLKVTQEPDQRIELLGKYQLLSHEEVVLHKDLQSYTEAQIAHSLLAALARLEIEDIYMCKESLYDALDFANGEGLTEVYESIKTLAISLFPDQPEDPKSTDSAAE